MIHLIKIADNFNDMYFCELYWLLIIPVCVYNIGIDPSYIVVTQNSIVYA